MAKKRTLIVVAVTVVSFITLAAVIITLLAMKKIGSATALLMLVALVGIYVGFGALIAIYRLISRLE
jgi:hypothetical protein